MKRRRYSNAELNQLARHYDGPYKPYDLVKELCIAIVVVGALALVLTIFFSSPDLPPTTIAEWAQQMPADFVTTAVSELDGTSETATYGPPYNHAPGAQFAWFLHLQTWLGVSHPINTAVDYVYQPLSSIPTDPALRAVAADYRTAPAKSQTTWTTNYTNALAKATVGPGDTLKIPAGNYGPVPTMMNALLDARPERRPRRRAADQQPVLPDRLHQAAAVPGGRQRCSTTARRRSTCSARSGA